MDDGEWGLLLLLLARVDKIELCQVDTGERLALNTTVIHFLLRQTQMKDLQSVLDLSSHANQHQTLQANTIENYEPRGRPRVQGRSATYILQTHSEEVQ